MTLTIENGSFSYKNGRKVLDDIQFTVNPGEVTAILGPNGAGKTTLLRCMMGFLKWEKGRSLLDGEDIRSIPAKRLWSKLAYVPQAKNVSSAFSVGETVLLGRTNRIGLFDKPKKTDVELAEAMLEKLCIAHLKEKKCSEISGGELQMTLIARALVAEPQILILDEPESNLDFKNQLLVLNAMSDIAEGGMSCIFNTHYPAHALQRAGKALLLSSDGTYLFGPTSSVVVEENIEKAFGVKARIGEIETSEGVLKSVVPLEVAKSAETSWKRQSAENRIAVVSVITSDISRAEQINEMIHEYRSYVIGRMGLPYREGAIHIINVTFDAPKEVVEAFAGALSVLPDISIKTTYAREEV